MKLHFRDHASVDLRYLAWRATTNTAVSVVNSTASVVRCVFANITSAGGSGISADQSDVLVTDCTFRDCSTPYRAGAILGSTFSIERCEFTGNSAGESGGAIHGVGRISHCLFVGNRAHSGAAVALSTDGITGGSTVDHCTFVDNEASGEGAVEFLESRNALRYSIITGTKGAWESSAGTFGTLRAATCGGTSTGTSFHCAWTWSTRGASARIHSSVIRRRGTGD
ncbi:MAG: right-handed parallel beta-helix repeat-containing protein [Candidatus Eisenbacteria bacterium]|nr:right-handed parallel beta-helix repeat-containing protein [Candidatus Eisenbacteria bacterium]